MKLKVSHVMDATVVVAQIIREQRPLPQKGRYRLARLHSKLFPEFTTANERRDAMIMAYDHHAQVPDPAWDGAGTAQPPLVESPNFHVPDDKMAEFNAAWSEIGDQEIEVDIEPIPLSQLDLGDSVEGSITANEFLTLGDLVKDD